MSGFLTVQHAHSPVYRVVRRTWKDPLDASFSRNRPGNRWNTAEFPALYCCCHPGVARAVVLDVFRLAGVELADLQPAAMPQLVEVSWGGEVVDVASTEGVAATGFPLDYPKAVSKSQTRRSAHEWYARGAEGVVCRSASIARTGFATWTGTHIHWGEIAIFIQNAKRRPRLVRRRRDLEWVSKP